MLRFLSFLFPLQAIGVVADSLLQRELRFRALAILDVISFAVGYGIVGVSLAVLGFAAWALVCAHMAQMVLRTLLILCIRPHPLWPPWDRSACAELLHFGGGFTASRFSNYLAGQAEHLVIGRWLGPVALGVYGRAYQLMAAPAVLFGNVLDRVLFPTMVQVQDQPRRLAEAYRRGVGLIALVILPLSAIVVLLAPEFVQILLGWDWQAVIIPLQILGVGMLFRTSCKISDSLVRARGAVYRRTWRQAAYAVFVLLGALIGQYWDVEGVAVAVLVTLALNFYLMAHLALGLAEMSWTTFAVAHLPGFCLAVVVAIPVALVTTVLRAWDYGPGVVLLLSFLALAPAFFIIVCLPEPILGRDGLWMIRKLYALLRSARRTFPLEIPGSVPAAGMPIRQLICGLTQAKVRYCRWKTRLDLERMLAGAGDLDLLVERKDVESFERVAEKFGFTRIHSMPTARAGTESHYFALDPETGALLHVHVSFSLLARNARLSEALEDFALRGCSAEGSSELLEGMPVIAPSAEFLIFVLRAMEQYARLGEALQLFLAGNELETKLQTLRAAWPVRTAAESFVFRDEATGPKLSLLAEAWPLFEKFLAALESDHSWLRKYGLARKLERKLREADTAIPAVPVFPSARLSWFSRGWWKVVGKRPPGGGMVIAFVGPDASGKSTLMADSARWLGSVFSVEVAHLGKPPSTWLTLLPNAAGRLLGRLAPRLRTFRHGGAPKAESRRSRPGLLYALRAVLLAWDRRALALRLVREARGDRFVLCDRYPTATAGAPDSARLYPVETGQSWLTSFLSRLENRLYRDIPEPGIVVRLTAPLATALQRNRERVKSGKEGDDFISRRHGAFFMPSFGKARIIELGTGTSKGESILSLRARLWDILRTPAKAGCLEPQDLDCSVPLRLARGTVGKSAAGPKKRPALIVEFIGVTGVGKSLLSAAVMEALAGRGVHVGLAEEVILSSYRLGFSGRPKLASAIMLVLSLPPFCRYFLTRKGSRLSRLAFSSIASGMGSLWVGANLVRNFVKRIGAQLLLEDLRHHKLEHHIVIWDEGAVHAAHNLFVHFGTKPSAVDVEEFGRIVPKPDLLVWVTAPLAQSTEVMMRRGHSRVGATSAEAHVFASHSATTFNTLARVHDVQSRIFHIDNAAQAVDGDDEIVRARARDICAFLMAKLKEPQEQERREGALQCLTA